MTSPQIQPRKKLLPTRPSKVLKKCKTFVAYSRRDYGLTNDQQLWARSLALSLSGWQTRQSFLKAQLEGYLKDKAAREVQEVSQEAARKATPKTQKDKHQAGLTKRQVKALKKRAERTIEAHQDNTEDITEDDLCHEKNGYDYITELYGLAPSAEEEESEFEDKEGLASESTNVVSRDAEHPSKQFVPTSQPTTNLQLLPKVPAVAVVDWRIKAHNGIMKKKLSMSKRWSVATWKQKSNVQERLLLLEYDGFDISELQNHKASSEEITAIILERTVAHQMPKTVGLSVQKPERPKALSEEPQDSFPVLQRPNLNTSIPPSALVSEIPLTNQRPLKAQPSARACSAPSNQFMPVFKPQSAKESTIEDETAPFNLHESYQPRPSPRLKRKRDFEDRDELTAIFHPALKKRKIKPLTKDELQPNALQEIKRKVLRRIFRPARSICRKSSVPSKVIFSKNKTRINQRGSKFVSTLEYLYTKQPATTALEEPLGISPRGYDNMMAEISFLTNTSAEIDDGLFIYNPDYDEIPSHAWDCREKRMETFFRQQSCITISKDEQGHPVFQGDTLTLAELFKVLRERELLHRVDWKWEGIHLSPSSSLLWSLSPETQNTLAAVELRLRQYARTGGVEIGVDMVDDGRRG